MKVLYKIKIRFKDYVTIYRLAFAEDRDEVYKVVTKTWQCIDSLTIEPYKLNRKYKYLFMIEGDKDNDK